MPHIVFSGKLDIGRLYEKIRLLSCKDGKITIQFLEPFINRKRDTIIIHCVVAEGHLIQYPFFRLWIGSHDKGPAPRITSEGQQWKGIIRLDRSFPVLKTEGIKLAMGLIWREVLYNDKSIKLLRTNIQRFIGRSINLPVEISVNKLGDGNSL